MGHSPSQNDHRTEAALFRHLVDNAAIPLVGSGIGGALVAVSQLDSPNRTLAFAWYGLVLLVIVLRTWLTLGCRKRIAATGYDPRAAYRYAISTALSGVVWGIAGFFVLDSSPDGTVVVITALQAMTMGGALTLAAYMPAFIAFSLPTLIPLIAALALRGGVDSLVLATYSAIFLVLVSFIARRMNQSLRRTWQLTFDKEDLADALKKAHDQLSDQVKTDGLTGIANRRQFDEILDREFIRLRRSGTPLSILMLDVDHFKAFNDNYGHIEGDRCLVRIAQVFQETLTRGSDVAARFGGEEFAAVLPDTDHGGARQLAEQLRLAVTALGIGHANSPTADHVTVSVGVITLNCNQVGTPEEAVEMADHELYRAKQEGRNRVKTRSTFDQANIRLVS